MASPDRKDIPADHPTQCASLQAVLDNDGDVEEMNDADIKIEPVSPQGIAAMTSLDHPMMVQYIHPCCHPINADRSQDVDDNNEVADKRESSKNNPRFRRR